MSSSSILFVLIFQYIIIASLYWFDSLNPAGSRLCLDQVYVPVDTTVPTVPPATPVVPPVSYTNFYSIYVATTVLASLCAFILLLCIYFTKLIITPIVFACLCNFAIIMMNFAVIYPDYKSQSPITQCWVSYTVPILVFTFFSYFVLFLFYKMRKDELNKSWS